jgi:tRNA/tmRNA/rRNA uracil-C5-methylase (TrmA/RlmC/RlmD family)
VYFDCIDADGAVDAGQCEDADILIVDPPRKGLSEGVLKFLTGKHEQKSLAGKNGTIISRQKFTLTTPSVSCCCSVGLKRVIYVGCGFEAVQRDSR